MGKLGGLEARAVQALADAGAPLSAYEVLAALRDVRPTAAAPTAYRTLEKLIASGLVLFAVTLVVNMAARSVINRQMRI